jgi:maltose alpha-D-glucosyltransferase/alpha-amylase
MLRSFDYALPVAAAAREANPLSSPFAVLQDWCDFWYAWTCAAFLQGYVKAASVGEFLPKSREELSLLLDAYVLEKAVYELRYELNNRPDWVGIPLAAILRLVS